MKPLAITQYTGGQALGDGRAATLAALQAGRSGPGAQVDFETAAHRHLAGCGRRVDDAGGWPADLAAFDCRNNRLAELGLRPTALPKRAPGRAALGRGARGRVPGHQHLGHPADRTRLPPPRPGHRRLPACLHYAQTHNTYSVSRYVRAALGLQGPAAVVSTACSSSAKVFAGGNA
jgi:3-oxoacyl-[acyl-carrier-protein] synthase-1